MKNIYEIERALNEKVGPKRGHFNVAPRYSGGSPAMVDRHTALHVAAQELEEVERIEEGVYGEEPQRRLKERGLKNIVYYRWEKGNKVYRYDLLTEETMVEPKCLGYKEVDRLKMLRNKKEFVGLFRGEEFELKQLEAAIEIHRQVV